MTYKLSHPCYVYVDNTLVDILKVGTVLSTDLNSSTTEVRIDRIFTNGVRNDKDKAKITEAIEILQELLKK